MVRPPTFGGHVLKVDQAAFEAIADVVNKLAKAVRMNSLDNCTQTSMSPFQPELSNQIDRQGRNCLLTSYIHYQAHLPHPDFRSVPGQGQGHTKFRPGTTGLDDEVGNITMRGHPDASKGKKICPSDLDSKKGKMNKKCVERDPAAISRCDCSELSHTPELVSYSHVSQGSMFISRPWPDPWGGVWTPG